MFFSWSDYLFRFFDAWLVVFIQTLTMLERVACRAVAVLDYLWHSQLWSEKKIFFRVSEPQHLLNFNNDISKLITGWMIMATSLNSFFKSVFFQTDKNLVGNTFKCNWWYWCEPYLLSLSYQHYKILIYHNYSYYLINLAL